MITKEQFDRFNEHFTIRESVILNVDFDLRTSFEEMQSAIQNYESDTFFQDSNWEETYSETAKSDGYAIYHKDSDLFIQPVSDLNDIVEFIEDDMDSYIQDMSQTY